jgi:hypothetical protein
MKAAPMRACLAAALVLTAIAAGQAHATQDEFSKRTVIQPGAGFFNLDRDDMCTMGFLLRDASGVVYGVTSGNCAPDGRFRDGAGTYTPYVGSRTWKPGTGPVVTRYERHSRPFGRYVAQVLTNSAYKLNYAIIRLDKGVAYDGTVAVVGGPGRRPFTGQTSTPTQVTLVCPDGYEVMWGQTHPVYDDGVRQDLAPTGIASPSFDLTEPNNGICAGAPVLAFDGTAVGIQSLFFVGVGIGLAEGRGGGPPAYRLDSIMAAAQQQLGVPLQLVQAGDKGVTRR